jgi:hypothetical protein
MATNAGHGHRHGHDAHGRQLEAPARVTSPLARGLAFRLGWAGGLSALLWLGVVWALQ